MNEEDIVINMSTSNPNLDTSSNKSIKINDNKFINKNMLLGYANQMLKESNFDNPNIGSEDYKKGVSTGIDRIIKLIERQ